MANSRLIGLCMLPKIMFKAYFLYSKILPLTPDEILCRKNCDMPLPHRKGHQFERVSVTLSKLERESHN